MSELMNAEPVERVYTHDTPEDEANLHRLARAIVARRTVEQQKSIEAENQR